MKFYTLQVLNNTILKGVYKVPRGIDAVVGIPRSGLIPATLIATYLNKPIADIRGRLMPCGWRNYNPDTGEENYFSVSFFNKSITLSNRNNLKKVLLVDDTLHSGRAMENAYLAFRGAPFEVIRCVVFISKAADAKQVDVFFGKYNSPAVWEWNIFKNPARGVSVDMDGVLCHDPAGDVIKSKSRYLKFLKTATPLLIPTKKIDSIITGRLDVFRKETVAWLEKHEVYYNRLIMKPENLRGITNTPDFKAEHYRKGKADIFIESCPKQASKIARLSGKPVYCQGEVYKH